jgi:hypothetical protein
MNRNENNEIFPVQVNRSHYDFDKYVNLPHWNSYWHQIAETKSLNPDTVLIIGVGDNIVGKILELQGIKVYTFDFDKELHPDFVGNIINIADILQGIHFDVILCCEVLEHLPYDKFEGILKSMTLITDNVIISLPHSPVFFSLRIILPYFYKFIGGCGVNICIHKFYREYKYQGEHYWEIGIGQYTKNKIRKSINKYFIISKQFLATNNHYHMFFIIKKR